jgi:hypothetical protein
MSRMTLNILMKKVFLIFFFSVLPSVSWLLRCLTRVSTSKKLLELPGDINITSFIVIIPNKVNFVKVIIIKYNKVKVIIVQNQ